MTTQDIADIVKEAARLMEVDGFTVNSKHGVENLVTSSDLAVQDFLTDKFSGLLPGSGFLCEEEDMHKTGSGYVWIIDPIDGTANYARHIPDCGISVALAFNGAVEYGVFYSPGRDWLFTARRGHGAFLNGEPLHVSRRPFEEGFLCTAANTYAKENARKCFDIIYDVYMQSNDLRRYGSAALELCMMAKGDIDLYFEYRLQPWDYAAASLILGEAGGFIAGADGKEPSLSSPSLIVAANSEENLAKVLASVQRYL